MARRAKQRFFTFAVVTPDGEEHITVRERSLADAEASLAKAVKVRGYSKIVSQKRVLMKGEKK